MRRFLVDLVLILIFVLLGRELVKQSEQDTIEDKIEAFNQKIERNEPLDHPSLLHLNQTEENIAGQLGNTLSHVIYETAYGTMEMIAMIFDEK